MIISKITRLTEYFFLRKYRYMGKTSTLIILKVIFLVVSLQLELFRTYNTIVLLKIVAPYILKRKEYN
ncbi:hypothetical protein Z042_16640 [Chania multitudinisentens RB-25]|uniref:Uncharacterized protein n=1 Tax=Chania multitudinisentens RB-25 TaxID=1441930 RepID=W0LGB9_9GAMM|nr:hypothetical protein Z042_16640 [Chania multitudinisentens RB-25]